VRYFIVAGEPSGDLLGGHLIYNLKEIDNDAEFHYWGGDQMQNAAQSAPIKHVKELAFMGLVEVIANLPTILSNFKQIKKDINDFQPDSVVLIDYPGFNLRLAKWLKVKNYKVIYYVSPTVWAWNKKRVFTIEKCVDLMLCILPFEIDFYKDYKVNAKYFGNPIYDRISTFSPDSNFLAKNKISKPILAILPGSRKQEILSLLPTMAKSAAHFASKYDIVISKMAHLDIDIYNRALEGIGYTFTFVEKDYQNLLAHSKFAMVTSGTASLETALFGVPHVVCYKMNSLSYFIAKKLVDIKYISLVNLITDEPIVRELIQEDCSEKNLIDELTILENKSKSMYDNLFEKIGSTGSNNRIAQEVYNFTSIK
jgi:lipid-A-disaccharide synthase